MHILHVYTLRSYLVRLSRRHDRVIFTKVNVNNQGRLRRKYSSVGGQKRYRIQHGGSSEIFRGDQRTSRV